MRLIVEADGGSRGNPGPAGYGAVVRDAETGSVLAEEAEAIGIATNNVAEYRGLLAGLRAAAELAPRAHVEARLDSKLVVEQLSGRWRIKHPDMLPLANEARKLAAGFGSVRYTWVPRERNTHADRLANEALDAAAQGRSWKRGTAIGEKSGKSGKGEEAGDPGEPAPAPATMPGEQRPAFEQRRLAADPPSAAHTAPGPGWISSTSPPTATLLLRHGETPLSVEKRFAGLGDIELTEHGRSQARAAAEALRVRGDIDVIVTSPLKRTRQTAAEVAAAVRAEVHEDDGFREMDFGKWEGLTLSEARRQWPDEVTAWLADPAVAPPGGESMAVTARRVRQARDALLDRFRGRTVLVVTHVTPIKTMVRLALRAPAEAVFRMHLDVACLSAIDWYDDGLSVLRSLNDTHHLRR